MNFGFRGFINIASSLDEFQLSFSHSLKKRAFRIKIIQSNLLLRSVSVLRVLLLLLLLLSSSSSPPPPPPSSSSMSPSPLRTRS